MPEPAPGAVAAMSAADLVESGHFRRAADLLEPVVKANPQDGKSAWLLSRAKSALGDLDGSMALAEAALATDDNNAAYHLQVAVAAGKQAQGANLLKQLTLVRRAKKELDTAMALDAANPSTQFGLMMYYYAVPALAGGDKARAHQIGEKVAEINPAKGAYYLGRLSFEMKDYSAAESYYRKSLTADPKSFETSSALAKFYEETEPDASQAEQAACSAVQAAPDRGDGWALLTRAYTMCGCWTQAAEAISHSEAADPTNFMPYYYAAFGAVNRGEYLDIAVGYLAKYLAHPTEGDAPGSAYAHWQLGLALEKQGNLAQAAVELQAALDRDSTLEAAKADLKRVNTEARH
jgi:tetratricopeptide (TPR) repeat protein